MKRFAAVLPAAILTCVLLVSCSPPALQSMTPTQLGTSAPSLSPPETLEPASPSNAAVTYTEISDFEFSDLADMVFTFSSGAGAWCVEISIFSDGTFSGYHSDQNMGDVGPDYPNGTRYFCSFTGKFSPLKKTGDYEYSMICESITQEGTADEVEIGEDGWRYITSMPFGLGTQMKLYCIYPERNLMNCLNC